MTRYADDITVGAIIGRNHYNPVCVRVHQCIYFSSESFPLAIYIHSMCCACVGVVLGYNITHTTMFDYDHIDLRSLNAKAIAKMVSPFLLHNYIFCVCVFLIVSGYH